MHFKIGFKFDFGFDFEIEFKIEIKFKKFEKHGWRPWATIHHKKLTQFLMVLTSCVAFNLLIIATRSYYCSLISL